MLATRKEGSTTAVEIFPRLFAEQTLAIVTIAKRQSLMEAKIELEVDSGK